MRADRDERARVRGAQQGSVSDLEALFRMHWPRAFRAAFLVAHDAAAAEDIAQESFLAAIRALDRLPPEQRAVIVMRYLLELTPGEIADALDLPRGTVNSRLRRGLDALGDLIGERPR